MALNESTVHTRMGLYGGLAFLFQQAIKSIAFKYAKSQQDHIGFLSLLYHF